MANSNLASKINMIPYAKSSIPIAAGDDFYAYIPVSIDTSVYKLICPILSDVTGDNCTKINISTCKWNICLPFWLHELINNAYGFSVNPAKVISKGILQTFPSIKPVCISAFGMNEI
nr:MAG TPA: hypothetical protein [Caudoviricetes sp.]